MRVPSPLCMPNSCARGRRARRQSLISEDLEEALSLSDRLQAIVGGRLSQPVAAGEADSRRLGLMMAGVWEELGNAV